MCKWLTEVEERGRWRRDGHWYVGKGKMVGVGRWEVVRVECLRAGSVARLGLGSWR